MKSVVAVGVAIGIAVAAPYLAPMLVSGLGVTTAVATAIVTIGLGLAAGVAMKALGLTSKVGAPTANNGTPTVYRQTIANSNIVYGVRRVGGLLTFFHASHVGDDYLRYFVIAVAGHRVQGVLRWFLGDEEVTVDGGGLVTTGTYAGKAWLWFERGMEDAGAHDLFVAECGGRWTEDHRGRGIAKIYAKFSLTDAIVQAGMPNITCEIEGKDDIRDPRTGDAGYSNNAALVFYDWMRLPREEGGFGAYADEIPADSWIAAQANVCDEDVVLLEGGSEKRYTLDGVIVTGAAPAQVRDTLIINCAGTFADIGGQFYMRPGYWVPPTANLSESDLAGPITVSAFTSGDEIANEVQGSYVEPAALYQSAPFRTQAQPLADPRQMDLDLAFVTSISRATRIGRIMLRRALSEKTVAWPMNVAGLAVQAMDTVQLDTDRYGLANYAWTVAAWKMSQDFGVVMSLREESPEIYDWDPSESPALPPHIPVARPAPIPNRYPDGTPIEDLQPAEPGATAGMSEIEAGLLAGLQADIVAFFTLAAEMETRIDEIEGTISVPIDELEARILAAEGEITSLSSGLATANSTISTVSTAVSNVEGDLADVTVRIGAAETTIETQQLAIETIDTQVATVTTDLATAGSNISLALTAIDVLEGSQATMATTLASQGSTITSLSSTTTTLAGTVATITSTLSAGRPNLLANGDFNNGIAGWSPSPGLAYAIYYGSVGNYIDLYNPTASLLYFIADIPYPGPDYYTNSFESVVSNGPGAFLGFQVLNAARDTQLAGAAINTNDPDSWNVRKSMTLPPVASGGTWLRIYVALPPGSGTSMSRHMIQRGQAATMWRDEASVKVAYSALSSLNSQYASLSSTVSVQGVNITSNATAISTVNGNITTLFGRASLRLGVGNRVVGWETNNNGSFGDFIIHTDYFGIADPDGGAGFSFSVGAGKVKDPSGLTRFQFGNLDV